MLLSCEYCCNAILYSHRHSRPPLPHFFTQVCGTVIRCRSRGISRIWRYYTKIWRVSCIPSKEKNASQTSIRTGSHPLTHTWWDFLSFRGFLLSGMPMGDQRWSSCALSDDKHNNNMMINSSTSSIIIFRKYIHVCLPTNNVQHELNPFETLVSWLLYSDKNNDNTCVTNRLQAAWAPSNTGRIAWSARAVRLLAL